MFKKRDRSLPGLSAKIRVKNEIDIKVLTHGRSSVTYYEKKPSAEQRACAVYVNVHSHV